MSVIQFPKSLAFNISDAEREEYEFLLLERAGQYMDAGHPQAEADREAFADLGCLEFWQYAKQINEWSDEKAKARQARTNQGQGLS